MGEVRPARRTRTHRAAAWGLTILTLAVLAADLVLTALNASRIGTAKVGVEACLAAGALLPP